MAFLSSVVQLWFPCRQNATTSKYLQVHLCLSWLCIQDFVIDHQRAHGQKHSSFFSTHPSKVKPMKAISLGWSIFFQFFLLCCCNSSTYQIGALNHLINNGLVYEELHHVAFKCHYHQSNQVVHSKY